MRPCTSGNSIVFSKRSGGDAWADDRMAELNAINRRRIPWLQSLVLRSFQAGFVHDYSSNGFAILLLLGRINPVSRAVHRETVHESLHGKIFDLFVMIRISGLKDCDESAGAGCIDPTQTGIKLYYVSTCRNGEVRN